MGTDAIYELHSRDFSDSDKYAASTESSRKLKNRDIGDSDANHDSVAVLPGTKIAWR